MQLNKLISLLIIIISIIIVYLILSSKEESKISNTDSKQVVSTNTTTQKKIQNQPENINDSITNKTKKEEQHKQNPVVKKTPETRKENEVKPPIFEKIGDSTYRISDRLDLSKIAELAAIEFANENNGEYYLWSDFNKAVGGEPVEVKDECNNSYYELVPLYIYGEYAGLVQADYLDKNTIKTGIVFPSSFFQSENLSDFKDKIFPIDKEEAIAILKKNIDNSDITYNSLVNPCAGENPLSPPISPFYSFSINRKRYLVSSTDGKIITEHVIETYKASVDKFIQQAKSIEKSKKNNL